MSPETLKKNLSRSEMSTLKSDILHYIFVHGSEVAKKVEIVFTSACFRVFLRYKVHLVVCSGEDKRQNELLCQRVARHV